MFNFSLRASALAALANMIGLTQARPIQYIPGRRAAHAPGRGVSANYTKRGPGRAHRRIRRFPRKRLAPAIYGGNWQGAEYLTYREHDLVNRLVRDGYPTGIRISREDALIAVKARRPQGG